MPEQNRLVALVTGATSGIGAAIARRLSNDGFAVVLHSRNSADAGHSLAAELGNATYLQADLADEAARKTLVERAAAHWGRLDVLVNNAGISRVSHTPISMQRRRQSGESFTRLTSWRHGNLSPRRCRSCAAAAIHLVSSISHRTPAFARRGLRYLTRLAKRDSST